jgi:hypothetical protein
VAADSLLLTRSKRSPLSGSREIAAPANLFAERLPKNTKRADPSIEDRAFGQEELGVPAHLAHHAPGEYLNLADSQ